MTATNPLRFELLDGLRGIAAIAVMIFHFTIVNGLGWLPGAWTAVDLFYVLSGFVLMYNYGPKITNGMSFETFLGARVLRLWPMHIIGMALGIVAVRIETGSGMVTPQMLTAVALNLFWIPSFNGLAFPMGSATEAGVLFPFNGPAWSLFFEIVVNILFFGWLTYYKKPPTWKNVAGAYVIFVVASRLLRALNPGPVQVDFEIGFVRVTAEFFLGAFIYSSGAWRVSRSALLAGLAMLVCLSLLNFGMWRIAFFNAVFLWPVAITLLANFTASGAFRSLCSYLGNLSYPLYLVHLPIYRMLRVEPHVAGLPLTGMTILSAAIAVAVASGFIPLDSRLRRGVASLLRRPR